MTAERDRILAEYLAALNAGHGAIDLGRTVICDRCNTDLTDDPRSGGFLFGSYGYGPCCAAEGMESIHRYREEHFIKAYCPDGVSYADWIRGLRGPDAQIVVRRGLAPGDIGGGA